MNKQEGVIQSAHLVRVFMCRVVLLGMLRDPLTMCDIAPHTSVAPRVSDEMRPIHRDINWNRNEAMQSKRFVLPLYAAPYHYTMTSKSLPEFVTPDVIAQVDSAIKLAIDGTGQQR